MITLSQTAVQNGFKDPLAGRIAILKPTTVKTAADRQRRNMEPCLPKFGTVTIFVGYVSFYKRKYELAQQALQCYLKGTNYKFVTVDIDTDSRSMRKCRKYKEFLFKRHCVASVYLEDTDWMLVLDADSGVINPNHCVEEWIDDRVHVLLYERFFNMEISAASYMVHNSKFAIDFLIGWANREFTLHDNWTGSDNGVLHLHVLDTVIPDAVQARENCDTVWRNATDYESYIAYVSCVKQAIGATRLWPGKIRIYRRAHAWIRDGFLTNSEWCDADFIFHGMKADNITGDSWGTVFSKMPDASLCGDGMKGWHLRPEKHMDNDDIRYSLANFELEEGKTYPIIAKQVFALTMPDIGKCFPNCEQYT